jgi:hypothetical protein
MNLAIRGIAHNLGPKNALPLLRIYTRIGKSISSWQIHLLILRAGEPRMN